MVDADRHNNLDEESFAALFEESLKQKWGRGQTALWGASGGLGGVRMGAIMLKFKFLGLNWTCTHTPALKS